MPREHTLRIRGVAGAQRSAPRRGGRGSQRQGKCTEPAHAKLRSQYVVASVCVYPHPVSGLLTFYLEGLAELLNSCGISGHSDQRAEIDVLWPRKRQRTLPAVGAAGPCRQAILVRV